MKKIPFWVLMTGIFLVGGGLTLLIVYPFAKYAKSSETLSGDDRPIVSHTIDCVTFANRYGFFAADEALCAKYARSEERARIRLAELRKIVTDEIAHYTYCDLKKDFYDAYDLERWVLDDAHFRMGRIGAHNRELRNLRIETARRFAATIGFVIKERSYMATNICPVELLPDNFVFHRTISVAVSEFSRIYVDYEEVSRVLYWRRLQSHDPLPHYDELPLRADVEAARSEADPAYNKK